MEDDALDPPPELESLVMALSCPICKDILNGPVSTPKCMHVFCSACVRASMDHNQRMNQKQICPTCREPCAPNDLHRLDTVRQAAQALPDAIAAVYALRKQCIEATQRAAAAELELAMVKAAAAAGAGAAASIVPAPQPAHLSTAQGRAPAAATAGGGAAVAGPSASYGGSGSHAAACVDSVSGFGADRFKRKRMVNEDDGDGEEPGPARQEQHPTKCADSSEDDDCMETDPEPLSVPRSRQRQQQQQQATPAARAAKRARRNGSADAPADGPGSRRGRGARAGVADALSNDYEDNEHDDDMDADSRPEDSSQAVGNEDDEDYSPRASEGGRQGRRQRPERGGPAHSGGRGGGTGARRTPSGRRTRAAAGEEATVDVPGAGVRAASGLATGSFSMAHRPSGSVAALAEPSKAADGMDQCPLCRRQYPVLQLQAHVDLCLARQEGRQVASRAAGPVRAGGLGVSTAVAGRAAVPPGGVAAAATALGAGLGRSEAVPGLRRPSPQPAAGATAGTTAAAAGGQRQPTDVKVPAARNWYTLKDKDARKVMRDAKLPDHGTKQDMAERYNRYRSFLQAERDNATTRSMQQLLDTFILRERQAEANRRQPAAAPAWMQAHIRTAQEQIMRAAARRSAQAAAQAAAGPQPAEGTDHPNVPQPADPSTAGEVPIQEAPQAEPQAADRPDAGEELELAGPGAGAHGCGPVAEGPSSGVATGVQNVPQQRQGQQHLQGQEPPQGPGPQDGLRLLPARLPSADVITIDDSTTESEEQNLLQAPAAAAQQPAAALERSTPALGSRPAEPGQGGLPQPPAPGEGQPRPVGPTDAGRLLETPQPGRPGAGPRDRDLAALQGRSGGSSGCQASGEGKAGAGATCGSDRKTRRGGPEDAPDVLRSDSGESSEGEDGSGAGHVPADGVGAEADGAGAGTAREGRGRRLSLLDVHEGDGGGEADVERGSAEQGPQGGRASLTGQSDKPRHHRASMSHIKTPAAALPTGFGVVPGSGQIHRPGSGPASGGGLRGGGPSNRSAGGVAFSGSGGESNLGTDAVPGPGTYGSFSGAVPAFVPGGSVHVGTAAATAVAVIHSGGVAAMAGSTGPACWGSLAAITPATVAAVLTAPGAAGALASVGAVPAAAGGSGLPPLPAASSLADISNGTGSQLRSLHLLTPGSKSLFFF